MTIGPGPDLDSSHLQESESRFSRPNGSESSLGPGEHGLGLGSGYIYAKLRPSPDPTTRRIYIICLNSKVLYVVIL